MMCCMKARAKFIGTTSLGYITDEIYNIFINENNVMKITGDNYIKYENIEIFLKNWNIIKLL
jgi:hypothetical protein